MKVYEAVAAALVEEGVTSIFGLMGDGNISLWGAMGRDGKLAIYSARNEAGAVAMADGYFRSTGEVGVATVTCGPGLTQVGTSLMAASRNRSPVVTIVGEIPPGDKNTLQAFDQRRFVEACSAHYQPITKPDNVADEVAEAFATARMRRCPVVLNIPIDLGEQELGWDFEYRPSVELVPPEPAAAGGAALDALVEKLARAERPIIVAGRGARMAGARDAIVDLADRTGALLATSLQAKGLFSNQAYDIGIAGAYASAPGEQLFAEADFVLGIGAELGYYTTEGGLLFPSAEVARIDIAPSPRQLGIVPGLYLQGDARATALRLSEILGERGIQKEGYRTPETLRVLSIDPEPHPRATDGLDGPELMRVLSGSLPEDVLVTSGAGHFLGFVAMHLELPMSADIQFSLQFGAVGQTLPVAFGIGVGQPGRTHVVIEGDGSLMMNLQEIETVARHGQQMVLIVWNDAGFGAEVHKLRAKGFDQGLAQWTSPDFVGIARAVGGDGTVLRTEAELGPAIAEGIGRGGLYLIDARVSPSAVSDAYQKIHFGQPNRAPRLGTPSPARSR